MGIGFIALLQQFPRNNKRALNVITLIIQTQEITQEIAEKIVEIILRTLKSEGIEKPQKGAQLIHLFYQALNNDNFIQFTHDILEEIAIYIGQNYQLMPFEVKGEVANAIGLLIIKLEKFPENIAFKLLIEDVQFRNMFIDLLDVPLNFAFSLIRALIVMISTARGIEIIKSFELQEKIIEALENWNDEIYSIENQDYLQKISSHLDFLRQQIHQI